MCARPLTNQTLTLLITLTLLLNKDAVVSIQQNLVIIMSTWLPPSRQKKKSPTIPWLFQTKLQAKCQRNAHLSIQILREHDVWKMNYSTNKLQVSYFLSCHNKISQTTKFSDFSLTLAEFHDISKFPEIPRQWWSCVLRIWRKSYDTMLLHRFSLLSVVTVTLPA